MKIYHNINIPLSAATTAAQRLPDCKFNNWSLGLVMPLSHGVIEGKSLKLSSPKILQL